MKKVLLFVTLIVLSGFPLYVMLLKDFEIKRSIDEKNTPSNVSTESVSVDSKTLCQNASYVNSSSTHSFLFFKFKSDAHLGYVESIPGAQCSVIEHSDGPTFRQIEAEYSADKNFVYFSKYTTQEGKTESHIVLGAEPASFRLFESQSIGEYIEQSLSGLLFRDSKYLYYNGEKVSSANPDTTRLIKSVFLTTPLGQSERVSYYSSGDSVFYFSYNDFGEITGVDRESFEILKDGYSKDKSHVYKGTNIVQNVDPENFVPPATSHTPPCTEC